jgi:hypothetical protein
MFNPLEALKPLRVLNPFNALQPGYTNPQPLPGESPFEYNHRMSVLANAQSLQSGVNAVGREIGQAGTYLFGSEQQEQQKRQQAAKPTAAASVFPQSFTDPKWDELEARYGDLAPMLKAIRTQGERTNYGPQGDPRYQNQRTGAYTPYQITSDTRKLFMNKGAGSFDPWSSPENAVAAAAQVLRDHGGAANPRAAVAGYFGGGAAARNPFASWGDGNLSVAQYVDRVLYGGGGEPGALRSPFDPRYLNQAGAQLDVARNAALTPTTNVFPGEPMPQMPRPEPVPKSDFSAAERHLEALRPIEFSEAEAKKLHWSNFWSGLGKAMASSPEGEGLGSFFLRLGGGALMAKGATGSEIQARKDAYDVKLAKFNAALYEHDMAKAQTMHNELVADWTANQNWVQNDYQQKLGIWQQNSKVQLVGNQLINQRIDPATGQATVTTTPVRSLILADDARDRANLSMQAFGQSNAANAQVTGIGNRIQGQVILGQAAQVLADENATDAERSAAAAYGPLPVIKYAVDTGQLASVLGEDSFEALNEEVMTTLSGQGLMPGTKEYVSAAREAMIGRMIALTQQSPGMFQRLNETFGAASSLYSQAQREERTREQVRTKAGNTTYTRTIEDE